MGPFLQLTDLLNDLIQQKGIYFKTIANKKDVFRRFLAGILFFCLGLFATIFSIKDYKKDPILLLMFFFGIMLTFSCGVAIVAFFKADERIKFYGDDYLDEKSLKTFMQELIDLISSYYPNVLVAEQHDSFNFKYILYFIPGDQYYSIYGNTPEKALKNLTILSKLMVQVADDKDSYKRIVKFDKDIVLENQEVNDLPKQSTVKILHKLEDNIINWLYYHENIKELKNE